jgi:ribonuclease HI
MKQLLLFSDDQTSLSEQMPIFSIWKLYIDGASRNNPGPAGAGVCIIRDDTIARTRAIFLGKKTNNEAEYFALLLGLFELTTMIKKNDLVIIVSDSQLLVRQISGVYKVKEPRLQSLHALAKHLLATVNYTISHVLREENKEADALANKGIDTKTAAPAAFIQFLHNHALSL